MRSFPDESSMEKSQESGDPIRGGSIGLNRVLGRFVKNAQTDRNPEFTIATISAFTIFRNVLGSVTDKKMNNLESGFVTDVNLFLDYYDTYLSHVVNNHYRNKKCSVVIYFPDYKRVQKELWRKFVGNKAELFDLYGKFLSRYSGRDELVRSMEFANCYWVRAGDATYPHKELARKLRDLGSMHDSYYSPGDKIALMTHVPLDYHISGRLRGIHLLESYSGDFKAPDQFRFRLDKEGRIPFNTTTHVTFGDAFMIEPKVTGKIRKILLEQAAKERWLTRSEEDIRNKIAKTANIPLTDLRKYDFI